MKLKINQKIKRENRIKDLHKEIVKKDRFINRLRKENFLGQVMPGYFHDQNHNLSVLSMYLTQLFDECEKHKITSDLIPRIIHQFEFIRRVQRTIEDFHEINREVKFIPIHNCIENLINIYQPRITRYKIQIITTIHEKTENIEVPNEDLHQIIYSLLSNSIEALSMTKKSKKIIILRITSDDYSIFINVFDNGNSIPEEAQKNIWQPYFSTWKKNGGLGLYLAKKRVESMNGEISFSGKINCFTHFKVILPRKGLKNEEYTLD